MIVYTAFIVQIPSIKPIIFYKWRIHFRKCNKCLNGHKDLGFLVDFVFVFDGGKYPSPSSVCTASSLTGAPSNSQVHCANHFANSNDHYHCQNLHMNPHWPIRYVLRTGLDKS